MKCINCNRIMAEGEGIKKGDGYVCEDCAKIYECCSICGKPVPRNLLYVQGGYYICPNCQDDEYNRVLNYHGFNDWQPKKLSAENNPLYLGIELEVDNKDYDYAEDNNQLILSIVRSMFKKDLIGSSDSSLDNGFEMVTQPMSLSYWKKNKISELKNLTRFLISHDYRSHDTSTCGLHVHVNKSYLGETEEKQDEVIDKIYLVMENFRRELIKFARRGSNSYSRFLLEGEDDIKENLSIPSIKDKKNNHDRYMALNITNNATIEFRLFKGTLKYTTIMATLELVDIIVSIAKNKKLNELVGLSWNDMIDYKTTEFLKPYLQERNLVSNKTIEEYSAEYIQLQIEKNRKRIEKIKETNEEVKKEVDYFIDKTKALIEKAGIKIYYSNFEPINLYDCAFNHIDDTSDEYLDFINNIIIEGNSASQSIINYKKLIFMIGSLIIDIGTVTDMEKNEEIVATAINKYAKEEIVRLIELISQRN